MSMSSSDELILGYIEEVRNYIPSLTKGIDILKEDPDQEKSMEEVHRLVHTIKGASSMMGIFGLSQIALQMEDMLDDIMAKKFAFTKKCHETMSITIGYYQTYCDDYIEKGVAAQELLKTTVTAYRRLRELPESGDIAAIEELITDVPEIEGCLEKSPDIESEPDFSPDFPTDEDDIFSPQIPDDLGKFDGEETDIESLIGIEPAEYEPEDYIPEPEQTTSEVKGWPGAETETGPGPLPELLDSFYEEAEEHLQDLGRSLNTLESNIMENVAISSSIREIIRHIRRSVHTIKGASAVIGLSNIAAFAHKFEDLLDWLFETADKIDPDIVAVLVDSTDLLERIVGQPKDPHKKRAEELEKQYKQIAGPTVEKSANLSPEDSKSEPAPEPEENPTSGVFGETEEGAEEDILSDQLPAYQTKTLRVSMDRVDDLVNLAGELIITSSAFDQKMDIFEETIKELEAARNRFREIARDMEVGFEVKALDSIKSLQGQSFQGQSFQDKNMGMQAATGTDSVAGQQQQQADFDDFDSLELDRYSELNMIIRGLNETVIDVGTLQIQMNNLFSDFDGIMTRHRVVLSELQDKVMRVRMTPLSTITNKLRRTTREVAAKLGKKIRLVIQGAEIELDRVIWEKITDPLMHLLRNAADHGIEPPELRQALNKRPIATIRLAASREGNQVVIRITDDGTGLNYDAIRSKALKTGITDNADELSEEELASLIFQPGFSTSGKISEVSGRGVGMDVVKENIRDLKGAIRVFSEKGKGTRFTIRIPLTLAAVRALLFSVGNQVYTIALNEIKEIVRILPEQITHELEDLVKIGDELLPIYYLSEVLLGKDQRSAFESGNNVESEYPLLLVVEAGGRRGALVINELIGQREIVIKGTGSHLKYVRGVSGATIMGDGSVVPILNVEELFWSQGRDELLDQQTGFAQIRENPLEIMVVDDSVSIRKVVSRLMEDQGWKAVTAKDGIDALEKLRDVKPDLIVLDIEMPRMNGYEFLSAIKAQSAYQNIPVAMLTSRARPKHRDKAMALGARGFIVKPYNDDEFINLVLKLTE